MKQVCKNSEKNPIIGSPLPKDFFLQQFVVLIMKEKICNLTCFINISVYNTVL